MAQVVQQAQEDDSADDDAPEPQDTADTRPVGVPAVPPPQGEVRRAPMGSRLPPKVDYQRIQSEREQKSTLGFFTIYKKGQGYWTRMGTLGAAALLAALLGIYLHTQLGIAGLSDKVVIGVTAGFILVYALLVYRLLNKPTNVDFLIATDSEMKKVNWTTRAELIGSTKVVIVFVFLIAIMLFTFDQVFGYLFYLIKVLKFSPFGGS